MYTAWLQLADVLTTHRGHYFLIFYVFVNFRWFFINRLAARYKPYKTNVTTRPQWTVPAVTSPRSRRRGDKEKLRVSFIIPVVDEPAELFRLVISSLYNRVDRNLDEIIVVINGPRNLKLEAICQDPAFEGFIQWTHIAKPGKRGAVIHGLRMSTGNIIGLLDSDTISRGNAITELVKPFGWYSNQDTGAKIGGVTTFQTIYNRSQGGVLRRFADWMEDVRGGPYGSMRAMSYLGTVGCLPGRMIAFRRNIIEEHANEFLGIDKKGWFWGFFNSVSDDRDLTNATLKRGYRTVLQSTAHVQTNAPDDLPTFWKQQLRWSRGSQYNTMRMFGHMLTHRRLWPLCFVYAADILIPFWWIGTMANMFWKMAVQSPDYYGVGSWQWQILLIGGGVLVSAAVRNYPHLKRYPQDILFLPAYVILLSILLTPIRIIGFFQMARDAGWGTRAGANSAVRTRDVRQAYPYVIGIPLLVGLSIAGPLLETPHLFLAAIQLHQLEIIAAITGITLVFSTNRLLRRLLRKRPAYSLNPLNEQAAKYV